MSLVHYQPTILQGTTKLGKITCGADGYYDMLAGGFDAYNSAGAFYDWNSAKPHFDNSSHFMRRVSSNALFGEDGHPTRIPGWTNDEWIVRILTVDPDRKSHHIKEIYIDPNGFKNKDGNPIFAVYLRLKPIGARAQVLADSLENENINTAFSIRCLTKDFTHPYSKIKIKIMQQIATFDHVDEPGISIATKYNNPALEMRDVGQEDVFTRPNIQSAMDYVRKNYSGMESESVIGSLESLMESTESGLLVPKQGILRPATRPATSNWR